MNKIIFPPLYIKLSLIKQFVKALDKDCDAKNFLKTKFPKLCSAKVTECVFIGPQLRQLLLNQHLHDTSSKSSMLSFQNACNGFLGRHKAANFESLIKNMKAHGVICHSNFTLWILIFIFSLCDVSDEHDERFHQEISEIESRYKGKPSPSLLADYCWTLVRYSKSSHRRSSVMKHF